MKVYIILLIQILVLPSEAKGRIKDAFMSIGDIIVPIGLVRDRAIHGGILKGHIRSQDDVWESIHFRVRRNAHLDEREAIDNV